MKNENTPVAIRRLDYRPPDFAIDTTALIFELEGGKARVTSHLKIRRVSGESSPLILDGVDLELESVHVDGAIIDSSGYERSDEHLILKNLPDAFELKIITKVDAAGNTTLNGLYRSSDIYCTQCEAEGFRRITYYLDRPDVLSTYTVRIEADRGLCPVLLSNGNQVAAGELQDGKHFVEWHDPFPKPSYLFALVAGDLACLKDVWRTASGRDVSLEIFVEKHNIHKCDHALRSLKESMHWDEQRYGLIYDLDTYMIVAVDDFNMGAMENKGLNVFNSKYVLADQETATDADFLGVESVIAHEYFHNWTGNRVTCRDWFQLSLKEGLTVFRDQQFSADQHSAVVKRIEDVRLLRQHQFPEDAGPMAHPIRPDEYIEINNFYTVTVYEKGAEVIRMIHTLLGESGFRAGMDLYFQRFDGQAVTCDDFVQAMEDASGVDLKQFRLWYSQAGTPVLRVQSRFEADTGTLHLQFSQSCPPTPGQAVKQAMHLPVRLALLNSQGEHMPLHSQEAGLQGELEAVVNVIADEQEVRFSGLSEAPVPSLLRGFSAPVILETDLGNDADLFLLAHDTDLFNRWEAGQRLFRNMVRGLVEGRLDGVNDERLASFHQAWEGLLSKADVEPALVAEAMNLPNIEALAERDEIIRIEALDQALKALKTAMANRHQERLLALVDAPRSGGFSIDGVSVGKRSLVAASLDLLGYLAPEVWLPRVLDRYARADNMTDKMACLSVICHSTVPERAQMLADFHDRWQGDRLVIDKWFRAQALSRRDDVADLVIDLMSHPAFDTNPNRIRSLVGAFAGGNLTGFHRADGAGYRLLADFVIEVDQRNPQVAAALVGPLGRWQRFDASRQQQMVAALRKIAARESLSPDVYEKVHRALPVVGADEA